VIVGIDTPDRRGRTGLDQHGRDLIGNPNVRIRDVEVLSCDWYIRHVGRVRGEENH
jgi:hypothetical protein